MLQACLKKNPAERPTPNQLIAMIDQPAPYPGTLGSFWPDSVARAIAAEQAAQTPSGLTPPTPFAATGTTGAGMASGTTEASGQAGFASPAPSGAGAAAAAAAGERAPTALATPTPPPGQVPGNSGHAPMMTDGYYAAAQHPSAPSVPPGPASPQASAGSSRTSRRSRAVKFPPGTPSGGQGL